MNRVIPFPNTNRLKKLLHLLLNPQRFISRSAIPFAVLRTGLARHNHGWKLLLPLAFLLLTTLSPARGGEKVYLSEEESPKMAFPKADEFEKRVVESTPGLREKLKKLIGKTKPSIWEKEYKTFIAKKEGRVIGYAVIVEEIGKHRPITLIAGITPEGKAENVAVMVYREPYGSEIRAKRFLKQYKGKTLEDPIRSEARSTAQLFL